MRTPLLQAIGVLAVCHFKTAYLLPPLFHKTHTQAETTPLASWVLSGYPVWFRILQGNTFIDNVASEEVLKQSACRAGVSIHNRLLLQG